MGFILGPTPVLASLKKLSIPAKLMTAEEGEDERTQRQYVSRNNKVPKVHPGRPFSKWLEMQDIKSGSAVVSASKDDDATDQTSLWSGPTGQFADHGKNIFADTQYRGERSERIINKRIGSQTRPPGILLKTVAIVSNKRLGPAPTSDHR